ncbi:hypothetical protein AnigIFM63309_011694 [Aspergillus niger]|nr:hypothetical protein AnigIFM62618_008894 [Aspergillus niger]GLA42959.1 hypothetical protein AnigIFM63309_011694 [Aspergillus niger]
MSKVKFNHNMLYLLGGGNIDKVEINNTRIANNIYNMPLEASDVSEEAEEIVARFPDGEAIHYKLDDLHSTGYEFDEQHTIGIRSLKNLKTGESRYFLQFEDQDDPENPASSSSLYLTKV